MTDNIISLDDKLAVRKKIKLLLCDQLIVDYKKHEKLRDLCTLLKIHLEARLKEFHGLVEQIDLREKKLIKMCVGAKAAILKKELRGSF